MSGRYLLDTNIVIALFAGDEHVKSQLASADDVFVPSIVIGELLFGARKSARVSENVKKIESFAGTAAILNCDLETAKQYGNVKDALRVKGKPIPENDIWIAAVALQHELVLVTRDGHFGEISKLNTVTWQQP